MSFVNEYIAEADYEKYDLRRICGEHNLRAWQGEMLSRTWTIDRERDAFLIKIWSHHESEFSGWAFYWKGTWIFFEMRIFDSREDLVEKTCWVGYFIKKFKLPVQLNSSEKDVISDLTRALGDYCGAGVFASCSQGTATIEFVEESAQ
jgi:hypothetical protein